MQNNSVLRFTKGRIHAINFTRPPRGRNDTKEIDFHSTKCLSIPQRQSLKTPEKPAIQTQNWDSVPFIMEQGQSWQCPLSWTWNWNLTAFYSRNKASLQQCHLPVTYCVSDETYNCIASGDVVIYAQNKRKLPAVLLSTVSNVDSV